MRDKTFPIMLLGALLLLGVYLYDGERLLEGAKGAAKAQAAGGRLQRADLTDRAYTGEVAEDRFADYAQFGFHGKKTLEHQAALAEDYAGAAQRGYRPWRAPETADGGEEGEGEGGGGAAKPGRRARSGRRSCTARHRQSRPARRRPARHRRRRPRATPRT